MQNLSFEKFQLHVFEMAHYYFEDGLEHPLNDASKPEPGYCLDVTVLQLYLI